MFKKFGGFSDDIDIERNTVVTTTSQAVKNAGTAVVIQAGQQVKGAADEAANEFLDALYGSTTSSEDEQSPDNAHPTQQQQKPHPTSFQTKQQQNNATTQAPTDKDKLEETRRKLQQTHNQDYFNPTIGDLEVQMKREADKRKQADEQRIREEEEAKQKKAQEQQQQNQQLAMPAGKGRMRMGKPVKSMDVEMGKKKTETFRGASG